MARAQNQFEEGEGGFDDDSEGVHMEDGDGMTVDLSGTDENITYPITPRGVYEAELMEMEFGQSQRSGNNMWTCIWELTDPNLAHNGKQPRQWLHLTFNDGGLPRVKRFLARIKCDDDKNLELLKTKFSPLAVADEGQLLGARARLRIDIRRYEGQNRNNVRDVLPPGDTGSTSAFGAA